MNTVFKQGWELRCTRCVFNLADVVSFGYRTRRRALRHTGSSATTPCPWLHSSDSRQTTQRYFRSLVAVVVQLTSVILWAGAHTRDRRPVAPRLPIGLMHASAVGHVYTPAQFPKYVQDHALLIDNWQARFPPFATQSLWFRHVAWPWLHLSYQANDILALNASELPSLVPINSCSSIID